MTSYLGRFDALVADLKRYDYIEVVRYEKRPPMKATALKAVERVLGAALAAPIRAFYEETDGITLNWRIKPTLAVVETKQLRKKSTDYYVMVAEYVGDPFANIDILPLLDAMAPKRRKSVVNSSAGGTVEFGGAAYKAKDFAARLRPFDMISDEYRMAFVVLDDDGDPPALLLGAAGTDWGNIATCDFASYIEMLLVTRGIVEARTKILAPGPTGKAASLPKNASEWRKRYTPKMFSKLPDPS